MANLNEAFNLQYAGNKYPYPIDDDNKVMDSDLMNNQNVVGNNFYPYQAAFNRIKQTNPKYDNINRSTNKPMCGYECANCHKSIAVHMAMQEEHPHQYIKGKFRTLEQEEYETFIQ